MCGIFGCVGSNAYNKVISGLKLLQYRGYDSCGIAYFNNGFKINKAVGTIEKLPVVDKTNIAFGHTRWATNGIVNELNAHPHISYDGNISIVHNGIIKNAETLKQDLIKHGISFYSETDTEVIANLIAYKMKQKNIEDVLKSLFDDLQGTYSLIIGTNSGDLYLIKKFSPLNVLIHNKEVYISSDISSLKEGELYSLKDNDILKITKNKVIRLDGKEIKYIEHSNSINNIELNKFKHYMQKEIYQTPNAVKNTYLSIKDSDISEIIKKYKRLTLIGCGTAYHSCLIGEFLFKNNLGVIVESHLASNYEINSKIKNNHLHIIVSQSGETADCIKVADNIKNNNGKFLIITNEPTSTMSKLADYHIFINAEKELAVASTKTYCCQVFVFAYIYEKLKNKDFIININEFCNELTKYINKVDINLVAEKLKDIDKLIMIAKDIDYLTLLEASLKIREIDYVYTLPMYAGELKHGTLSLIDQNSVVLTLNTEKNNNKLQNAINEIKSREGTVIDFSEYMNFEVKESFKSIFSIIPFQLLSYKIAVLNNRNPDMPRNLAKSVTVE